MPERGENHEYRAVARRTPNPRSARKQQLAPPRKTTFLAVGPAFESRSGRRSFTSLGARRMNLQGSVAHSRLYGETTSARATSTWRTVQAGARAPVPPLYGSGRPAFSPPTVLRGRGRIFPAPARGTPCPCDRRAINVQLALATSGRSRSLTDTPTRRSGHVEGRSRTDSQADSRSSCRVLAETTETGM
jgi:hypothetical protein